MNVNQGSYFIWSAYDHNIEALSIHGGVIFSQILYLNAETMRQALPYKPPCFDK